MENIKDIIKISKLAGKKIMEIYESNDFDTEYKGDSSPLTLADKESNKAIVAGLKKLTPNIPILSEEEKEVGYEERKKRDMFWCVDPLDGTKEFIKRNGEFTVNIALIKNNEPILGIIYAPVLGTTYWAEKGKGTFKENLQGDKIKLENIRKLNKNKIRIVASRSHRGEDMDKYIGELEKNYKEIEYISAGSSLKFCLLAEGKADIYPRFVPTMEWDTAAGDAILRETGGNIIDLGTNNRLSYNKEILKNNYFIAK